MKLVYNSGVIAILLMCTILPAALGLQCYGCARNEQSGRSCEDFNEADEAVRKTRFAITCPSSATGCAYMKFDIDNTQAKFSTESLECYVPDEKLLKISEMDECVDTAEGKSLYKVCACSDGDFCLDGGATGVGVGGSVVMMGLTLVAITVSRWIQ